ncbi:MAG: DUF1993 domain-containing protein [Dokdonella sp.]
MSISLYAASVPVFTQMLGSLDSMLAKGSEHAESAKIDADAYLQARLFPDMFPLLRQVQIACDFARGVSARLAGVDVPSHQDSQSTFADLRELIAASLSFIGSFDADKFDDAAARDIVLRPGTPKERSFKGDAYLMHYGLPQFFFHVTTAYALLRHNGIAIGKRDFMGVY